MWLFAQCSHRGHGCRGPCVACCRSEQQEWTVTIPTHANRMVQLPRTRAAVTTNTVKGTSHRTACRIVCPLAVGPASSQGTRRAPRFATRPDKKSPSIMSVTKRMRVSPAAAGANAAPPAAEQTVAIVTASGQAFLALSRSVLATKTVPHWLHSADQHLRPRFKPSPSRGRHSRIWPPQRGHMSRRNTASSRFAAKPGHQTTTTPLTPVEGPKSPVRVQANGSRPTGLRWRPSLPPSSWLHLPGTP